MRSVRAAHSAVLTVHRGRAGPQARPISITGRHSHALKVYTINLQELVKFALTLSRVPHVAWRYLWKQSRECPSVEVVLSLQNKRHIATSRSSGAANRRLIRAFEQARQIGGGKYVLRLLSAPPLVYSAVWLKSFRHRTDKMIVVETIVPKIRPLKVYTISDFLDLLRPEAAMLVEHSQSIKAIKKARGR
jgi:hypothetical protein